MTMSPLRKITIYVLAACTVFIGCTKTITELDSQLNIVANSEPFANIKKTFGSNIDLLNLQDYAGQAKPNYITKDNGFNNPIQNTKATLGRVLFYDKNLSIDNTISCGSCHKQNFAFGDTAIQSNGVQGGRTIRHSMRLVNNRFSLEEKYFWNKRAASLEIQTTMPIQDHAEMGFSGTNGRGDFTNLINKLSGIGYYKELFKFTYGDTIINETRIQETLAQFIRSIQSFDSKFDIGRALVNDNLRPFPNFTVQENNGKELFITPPIFDASSNRIGGGLGCQGCHRAPEFDIDTASHSNGIIGTIGSSAIDVQNTKSPSLRDLLNPSGLANSPMMHTGSLSTLSSVLEHYNNINFIRNTNLDARLRPNNIGQKLNLTSDEINSVIAFMKTLTGRSVYTDTKWSDPFLK